jgi:CheY-like chemotaxis protein
MTLSSLLVCADEADARILGKVLAELDIRVEPCPDSGRAAIRLAQDHFDLVILDCESRSDLLALLREIRNSRINNSSMAVVVLPGQDGVHEIFSLGVNFVLYKPVDHERSLSSLRAACAVVGRDKRRKARAPVHTHATIDYGNVERGKATLVDLAEEGMAVQFGSRVPPTSKIYFQFKLPGQSATVRLSGQVVWQDWNGRAGIQFADVPKSSRRLLDEFLSATLSNAAAADRISAVTVEVEQSFPSPAAPVAVEPERVAPQRIAEPQPEDIGPRQDRRTTDRGDRREQTRYACRVGAEVYRTGVAVPHHCSLTDLSPGGCYLEMPIPFPTKTPIEITVRTQDLKLRLRGTIQTSHPGYGMGVVFQLESKDQCGEVQKLLDFVAATVKSSE